MASRGGAKAVAALLRRGFIEQRKAESSNGEAQLHITTAGLQAIGIEVQAEQEALVIGGGSAASSAHLTKAGMLLTLIGRPEGAAMPDMIQATGCLPHTVRATLTGLRRKGHSIERSVCDGRSCYRIGNPG